MLTKTGLLVLSNPRQISKILSSDAIQQKVKKILYIQLLSSLGDPFGNFHTNVFTSWPSFTQTVAKIYTQAAQDCGNLDVRVLLSGIKYKSVKQINTLTPIDLVIFDQLHSEPDIDNFLKARISNLHHDCDVITVDCGSSPEPPLRALDVDSRVFGHAVLGGTFDRLHTAHKLLLTEAALRASKQVTVGVTEESMLKSKTLWELIQPIDDRVNAVQNFLKDICSEIDIKVVPISDPFGPTKSDPDMDLLVVSAETIGGGNKVNEVRNENKLKPLDIIPIDLIDEPHPTPIEESKISSSTARIRLLGALLREPANVHNQAPHKPYVVGLTGGIASGKSKAASYIHEHLGADIIDCDLVAHSLYKPATPCYKSIVEAFGLGIVSEGGEINRRELGSIVFQDPSGIYSIGPTNFDIQGRVFCVAVSEKKLDQLNQLVWPAIAKEVNAKISRSKSKIVFIEAAVLLTAGWQHLCNEVWTTLVPREEAIKRLMERNNLTKEQAANRIDSQQSNKYYADNAHVVLCTLWPIEYTRQQIDRAWNGLNERVATLGKQVTTKL